MNEPDAGFANLRVINAGVCPINAFGVGLNTEVPATEVWKLHINSFRGLHVIFGLLTERDVRILVFIQGLFFRVDVQTQKERLHYPDRV